MCDLLRPFAQYTSLIGGEEYTTLSAVIPAIMELELHLEEMKRRGGLAGAAANLQSELKRRFDKILNPKALDHDPIFLLATALDPRYRVVLDTEQMVSARTELLSQLKEMRESNSSLSSSSTGSPSAASISVEENLAEPSPSKQFRLLSGLIEKRLQQNIGKHSNVPPEEEEVDCYFSATHTLAEKVDPVFF